MTVARISQTLLQVLRGTADVAGTPFANLGFETAGASAGLAASWEYKNQAAAEEFAGFDTTAEATEDFEEGWSSNENFLFALSGVSPASFDGNGVNAGVLPPEDFEDFEDGWLTAPFVTTLVGASASFDSGTPENFEDFEEQWAGNENYITSLSGTSAALFDAGANAFENFEGTWTPMP